MFDYGAGGNEDEEAGYRFGVHTFAPGEYVSISEHGGERHTFKVNSVEPPGSQRLLLFRPDGRVSTNTELSRNGLMSAQELVTTCNAAMRDGIDFPTLWHTIIKPHPTVAGVPIQRWDGRRTYLEIPLLRGDCIIVDMESRTVSLR